MATCYFKDLAASDYAWETVANWWTNAACTVAKGSLPIAGDTIYIAGRMDSGPTASIAFAHIHVADPTTGGESFSVDFTNATGQATFNYSSCNNGTITGNCTFNDSSCNNGTITGNCTFYAYSGNIGTINGACTFNNSSVNNYDITGACTFNGISANNYTITGACTFNGISGNSIGGTINGACTFNDSSYNYGNLPGGYTIQVGKVPYATGAITPDGITMYPTFYLVPKATDILGTGLL